MSHSKMLIIETEEGNIINKFNNHLEKGTDYSDNFYKNNEYGTEYSDEEYNKERDKRRRNDDNNKDDLYDVNSNEYDYYPNEVDEPRYPKTKLSASTCRPRRGIGNDVTLNVTCGDRVIIDCDLPRFGSCISRFVRRNHYCTVGCRLYLKD